MMTSTDHRRICAIIVNYQTGAMIIEQIGKLRSELSPYQDRRIFIVDNASPNGDLTLLENAFAGAPDIEVLDGGENLGFARGNNLAYARALDRGADYVLFINPDSYPEPRAVKALVHVLDTEPKAAIVGAQLLDENGALSACRFRFPSALREFANETEIAALKILVGGHANHTIAQSQPIRSDWVSGAAFLLRVQAAPELMDGSFFLYFEETDMMRQLTNSGWEVWHAPDAKVVHIGGAATGVDRKDQTQQNKRPPRHPSYWFDSWRYYYNKNHGQTYAAAAAIAKAAGVVIYQVKQRLKGAANRRPENYLKDIIDQCFMATLKGKADQS